MVEYNVIEEDFEVKLKEMKSALTKQIAEEADISEVIESVKHHVEDTKLPDIAVVRILWYIEVGLCTCLEWFVMEQHVLGILYI